MGYLAPTHIYNINWVTRHQIRYMPSTVTWDQTRYMKSTVTGEQPKYDTNYVTCHESCCMGLTMVHATGYMLQLLSSRLQTDTVTMGFDSVSIFTKIALVPAGLALLFHLIGYSSNSWQRAESFGQTIAEEGLWKTCNYALMRGCADIRVEGTSKIAGKLFPFNNRFTVRPHSPIDFQ